MKYMYKAMWIVGLFLCISASTFAQNISMKMGNTTVKHAIEQLKKTSGYSFVFSSNDLNTQKRISVNLQNATIDQAVATILQGQDELTYKIENKNIIVSRNKVVQQESTKRQALRGRVVDTNGEPIIGASVAVNGTTQGAVTDVNGNFTLESVSQNATLTVSYIGYISQQVKTGGKERLTVELKEDTEMLDEVVVVGYGSQVKVNLTGSVSSISSKELTARPITSVKAGVQGLVPGLTITNSEGRPGEDSSTMLAFWCFLAAQLYYEKR